MTDRRSAATSRQMPGLSSVVLRPVRGTNAFEATVEQLATTVRLGVLADGDRLPPERELAGALGVSRATLREAIAALREAGLLVTRSGRGGGTMVTHEPAAQGPSRDKVTREQARRRVESRCDHYRDSLVLRRVVEPGAAAIAADRNLTGEERAWLRTALATVGDASDPASYRRADSCLHLAIAALSGSPQLIDVITAVQRDLHEMLTAIPVLKVNIAHSNTDHRDLVQAILSGKAERARAVMEQHCDGTAALLRGLLAMESTSVSPHGGSQ
jgi:GntR family transcriptional regulator, transcriptional repressor for pyruvate dehydrogenase complex